MADGGEQQGKPFARKQEFVKMNIYKHLNMFVGDKCVVLA